MPVLRRPDYAAADLTIKGLQRVLYDAGLPTKGTKAQMVARIADQWHATDGKQWLNSTNRILESAFACFYAEQARFFNPK
jgi:hypothetical protein